MHLSLPEFAESVVVAQPAAQPMKLIRDIARTIGLKFVGERIKKGPDRDKRAYTLDMSTVQRMSDYGSADWDRLDSTEIPGSVTGDPNVADIFELLAS